jgi:SMI1 / KNR4 family (SUKH-1)
MSKYDEKMEKLQTYSLLGEGSRPATTDDVTEIETEIKGKLPREYSEFLIDYGCCGFRAYVLFPLIEASRKQVQEGLSVFFGVSPGGAYDLLANYRTYRGRMPSWLLPIAEDPFGNQICLAIRGNKKGAVYFWDHEQEETGAASEEPGTSNLHLISHSFDRFIDSLEFEEA